ncbi:hypothetical protein AC629_21415 [Bradyrhizobium sp. NAS80.1]|nr:hypothetical protein AC629_21415 [Bradyrhizobium sp. NAS80.1]
MINRSLAVLGLVLVTCGATQAQTSKPIKVGVFVAVTGPGSFLGDASKKTFELYTQQFNKNGGVDGRQIELVLYDSKTNPKEAASLARKLIDQDQVDVLIGANTTGEAMAVVPFVEEANIPFIALAGGSVVVDPVKKWVFKTPHTDQMSVEKIYAQLRKEKRSKVALLSGAAGYDQSCRKNAKELSARLGIDIVSDEQHGSGDTDVTTQLTKIRGSGADALIYCGAGAPSALVARNYKQLGLTLPLYMTVGVASQAYIEAAGPAAEGSRVTGSAILAFADMMQDDPIYNVSRSLHDGYVASYKEEPSAFSGYAYDALLLTVEALRRAGTTDKAKVRDALEGLKNIPGVNGIYNFSATDHLGFSADSMWIVEVKDGRYRKVD